MPRNALANRLVRLIVLGFAPLIGAPQDLAAGQDTMFTVDQEMTEPSSDPLSPPPAVPHIVVLAQATPPAVEIQEPDDDAEIRIIQALEKPIDLKLENLELRSVIRALAKAADVPIEIKTGTLKLLPYGSKTVIQTLDIEQKPLGAALTDLLGRLGLTYKVESQRLAIVPTKPLRRIVRRATWEELTILHKLRSKPWSRELFLSLQLQFQDARTGDFETNREQLLRLAETVGGGSAAEVLEHACDQYGWCWHPSGKFIAVLTKTRQIERQLDTRVSLGYVQTGLREALLDLTNRAGVLLKIDPGALAKLPPQTSERFSLAIENATVRQALEVVAGQTGLVYAVEPDGLRFSASTAPPPSPGSQVTDSATAATIRDYRSNPIVGEITIRNADGTPFSFFIREDDLPPEVNEMRKAKIHEVVNEIRRVLFSQQQPD